MMKKTGKKLLVFLLLKAGKIFIVKVVGINLKIDVKGSLRFYLPVFRKMTDHTNEILQSFYPDILEPDCPSMVL